MSFTIGAMELAVVAALVLALVRPGLFKKILRLIDDYCFAEEPADRGRYQRMRW